jgi:hypothetical protein
VAYGQETHLYGRSDGRKKAEGTACRRTQRQNVAVAETRVLVFMAALPSTVFCVLVSRALQHRGYGKINKSSPTADNIETCEKD